MDPFAETPRFRPVVCALAGAFLLAAPPTLPLSASPAAAQGAESAWSPSPKSRARLVSAGGLQGGAYVAGVEIALEGRALTYWRMPGDAGVPPGFDFSRSENLEAVEIAYPAPERHDEGAAEAFGWRQGVIFPLAVRPRDPARPVVLALQLNYAACEKICIPSEGSMKLALSPAAQPTAHAARIDAWRARAPVPAAAAGVAFALEPLPGAKRPAWRVRVTPEPDAVADLFAEGADGHYFDTKRSGADFKLILAERPPGAAGPAGLRLTLTRTQGAVEHETKLDVERPAP